MTAAPASSSCSSASAVVSRSGSPAVMKGMKATLQTQWHGQQSSETKVVQHRLAPRCSSQEAPLHGDVMKTRTQHRKLIRGGSRTTRMSLTFAVSAARPVDR